MSGTNNNSHKPPGEGELEGVLDEAIATGADHEGGPGLDAVLHHHVCSHTAGVQSHLPKQTTGEESITPAQRNTDYYDVFSPRIKHREHSLLFKGESKSPQIK
jgi:hypothetical protein